MKLSKEAKQYWGDFGCKCLDNLASVKVWFFMAPFVVSTGVLIWIMARFMGILVGELTHDQIKLMKNIGEIFIAWCTFNVSLAGTVIVVRETFKIKKMTSLNIEKRENTEIIERIRP
jgi:hypothetical protein